MPTTLTKTNFYFDEKTLILHKHYFGIITVQDILTSWKEAIQNDHVCTDYKRFLLDYRNAHFNVALDHVPKISEFYQKQTVFFNARIAVITYHPEDIVVPILLQNSGGNYSIRPFSTSNAASNWLIN